MSKWTHGQRNADGLTYEQNAAMWRLAHAIASSFKQHQTQA